MDLPATIDLATLDARGIDIVPGSEPGWLGYAVAPAGDVNGDGASDFVVGASAKLPKTATANDAARR